MKIRLLDLNVKNKKIEKPENDSLRGALVHIKYKKEEKIMLKYDIDVISTCKPIINIKCIFQIEDDIEFPNSDILNEAVKELEKRIDTIIALVCEESGF